MIELKGITWNHSRGFTPLIACCQRYHEKHSEINVEWHKRSLQAFAGSSVETLSKKYDLLVIDHPSVGEAYKSNCLVDLNQHIDKNFLNHQRQNSTGASYYSYSYQNAQLALPVDAAAPVSCYRKDLLQKHNEEVPQTWEQLINLAKKGKVAMPAIAIDALMNFYMFCIACGKEPFINNDEVIDEETGESALLLMQELYSELDKKMFAYNPIAVAELMSSDDNYWYCPFMYGYSNYARKNYVDRLLTYDDVISYRGNKFRSILGGTGIAVSAYSRHIDEAVEIACMLTSQLIQSGLYVEQGGQPAHLQVWKNNHANDITNHFFSNTLPALQRAYMRPRYNGYLQFQYEAGNTLHQFLQQPSAQIKPVISKLNKLYRKSLPTYEKHLTA